MSWSMMTTILQKLSYKIYTTLFHNAAYHSNVLHIIVFFLCKCFTFKENNYFGFFFASGPIKKFIVFNFEILFNLLLKLKWHGHKCGPFSPTLMFEMLYLGIFHSYFNLCTSHWVISEKSELTIPCYISGHVFLFTFWMFN